MSLDLSGRRFNSLTVTQDFESREVGNIRRSRRFWLCICDCNTLIWVAANKLTSLRQKSCGCANFDHGMSRTPLYRCWESMKGRCLNPNDSAFHNYGKRGIKICTEWLLFKGFMEWALANGYQVGLELDRSDNNGNYEPSNCEFVSHSKNNRNKRNNRIVEVFGERLCLTEAKEKFGENISLELVRGRLALGWPINEALTQPVGVRRR